RGKTADFGLVICEGSGGLELALAYSTELFERTTVVRWAGYLESLLWQVSRDPEVRIGDLEMVPEAEQARLLSEWNATEREYPRERCLGELFEEQVKRAPASEAVVFGPERVSYGELNARANRLAGWLRKRGVGAEVLVPLLLERSVAMVV